MSGQKPKGALRFGSKSIRPVLWWQVAVTAAVAAAAGLLAGGDGAISAALGGGVSFAASLVFVAVASRARARTAGGTLYWALRAEAAKVVTVVLLLWAVFANYPKLVPLAFLTTFAVTVVIFSMAFFVREF